MGNVTTVHKTAKNFSKASNTPSYAQAEDDYYIQPSDFDESGEDFSHNNLALKDRDPDSNTPSTIQNRFTPI